MPDPEVARNQQRWHEYCDDPTAHSPHRFTHLFTESALGAGRLTGEELQGLLESFPGHAEMAKRIGLCLERRWDGPILAVDDERIRLANAHTGEIARLADDAGLTEAAAELAVFSEAMVIDRSDFDADPYREDPADVLTDTYWDAVTSEIASVTPTAYGLKEACWGITADRYVTLRILEPMIDRDLGLGHYMELWRRGSLTAVADGRLVVSRR